MDNNASSRHITEIANTFDMVIAALANYTADDTKQKGQSSKALDGILKSMSLIQAVASQPDPVNNMPRLDNIKTLFNKEGLVGVLSDITTKETLDNFKTNVTNICNAFGEQDGQEPIGVKMQALIKPLTSLKTAIERMPSFETSEGIPLGEKFKQSMNSLSQLVITLNDVDMPDKITMPDFSLIFDALIKTNVMSEEIKKKEWKEISKDEFDILSAEGGHVLNQLGDVASRTDKFFKEVETVDGVRDVTTYESKLKQLTTGLIEIPKALAPFTRALSVFASSDLSLTMRTKDIKATDDVKDPNGNIIFKKGDVIASGTNKPITAELISDKIAIINSIMALSTSLSDFNPIDYTKQSELQVKLYNFVEENYGGKVINESDGIPLTGLLLLGTLNPIKSFKKSLDTFITKLTDLGFDNMSITPDDISKKIDGIIELINSYAESVSSLNKIQELDQLSYITASLKLGSETESVSNDMNLLNTFIINCIKNIEKVSSTSLKTILIAPIKIKLLSNTIQSSISAMIQAIDSINESADFHNLIQVLGWKEGTNQYLINADGSYKMEDYIDDEGKAGRRKIENAKYVKGHFEAESGLFKIGDYMATLIGIIDKVSSVNPIKMKIAQIRIKASMRSIASTIAYMARVIVEEMKTVSSGADAEALRQLMSSTTESVSDIIRNGKQYNADGDRLTETDIEELEKTTSKTTNQGLFEMMISFFTVYDNMMKIADEKGVRLFLRQKKAEFRIKQLVGSVIKISAGIRLISMKMNDDEFSNTNNILKQVDKSMESMKKLIVTTSLLLPLSIVGSLGAIAMRGFLITFVGEENQLPEKDTSVIGLMIRMKRKWEAGGDGKGKGGDVGKTLLMITGSMSLFVLSLIAIGAYVKHAIVGVVALAGLLAMSLGILWVLERLNKDGAGGLKDGPVDRATKTLLLISGSFIMFALSLLVLTKVQADFGTQMLQTLGMMAIMIGASVGIMWVLNQMKSTVTQGALVILILSGAFLLLGFAMKQMFESVKGVEWGEFGMIAATLTLMVGAIVAIGAILSTPLVGQVALGMILTGVGIMAAVGAAFLTFASALIKINDVFKENTADDVRDNVTAMMACMDDMITKVGDFRNIDRKQKRNMRRVASIAGSISTIATTLKDIADLRIAIYDEHTGKVTGYRQMTSDDFTRAGDNVVTLVGKMEEIAKILSDNENKISRRESRRMKRQARRLGRIERIVDPINSALELVQTLADGKITYTENGKEITMSINEFFSTKSVDVNKTLGTVVSEMEKLFSGINTASMSNVSQAQSSIVTSRFESMSNVLESISGIGDKKITENFKTTVDNTSRMVTAINSLNTDKAKAFERLLDDMKDFNDELSDIFEKIEKTMSTLVSEMKSMNGMSSSRSQNVSTSTNSQQHTQHSMVNLSNIENDVDEMLAEIRNIRNIMKK